MNGRDRNRPCPGGCGNKVKNCTCRKGTGKWLGNWKVWIAITIMVICLVALIINALNADTPEPRNPPSVTKNLRERLLSWPLPPAPPIKVRVKRPKVPSRLPPVRFSNGRYNWVDVSERLRVLVQQHPVKEINTDLHRLIDGGTIGLNGDILDGSPASASFAVVEPSDIVTMQDPSKLTELNPVLRLRSRWIAGLTGEQDILEGMLVIFHEYQHYKQWRDTPAAKQQFWALRSMQDELANPTPQYCIYTFRVEVEPYTKECRFSNAWGARVFASVCQWVDTPYFTQTIFLWLMNAWPPGLINDCGVHIARDVGHPDFP